MVRLNQQRESPFFCNFPMSIPNAIDDSLMSSPNRIPIVSINPHQPREYDAVLGNHLSIPTNAAVLGGIEGVKNRLAVLNTDTVRIAALHDALEYDRKGLELIMQIVETESGQVQWTAWSLLWERASKRTNRSYSNIVLGARK